MNQISPCSLFSETAHWGFGQEVEVPPCPFALAPTQRGAWYLFILQMKVPELNPSHVRARHDENPLVKGTGGGGWYKTGHGYPFWFLIVEVFLMAFFTAELGLRAVMADHDRSFWLSPASHCFFVCV